MKLKWRLTWRSYLIIIILSLVIIYNVSYYNTEEIIEIKINNKESVTTGSGESTSQKYLIYCEKEVFENTDNIIYGKFNSSDFYNDLKIDSSYTVKVVGWRIPILSKYRNIVKIL